MNNINTCFFHCNNSLRDDCTVGRCSLAANKNTSNVMVCNFSFNNRSDLRALDNSLKYTEITCHADVV